MMKFVIAFCSLALLLLCNAGQTSVTSTTTATTVDDDRRNQPFASTQDERWFAYMKTTSSEKNAKAKNRTHVFAMTTTRNFADRYINLLQRVTKDDREKINRDQKLHQQVNSGSNSSNFGPEKSNMNKEDNHILRDLFDEITPCDGYKGVLDFASKTLRNDLVIEFFNKVTAFNEVVTSFFEVDNQTATPVVPPNVVLEFKEAFGPHVSLEDNQRYPTGGELNDIHDQYIRNTFLKHAPTMLERFRMIPDTKEVKKILFEPFGVVDWDRFAMAYEVIKEFHDLIHRIEPLSEWAVANRFGINFFAYGGGTIGGRCYYNHEMLTEEDFRADDVWKSALEIGGLYLRYPHRGKNMMNVMWTGDMDLLEDEKRRAVEIRFTDRFTTSIFTVWTLGNATELEIQALFKEWWKEEHIYEKYGYEFGNIYERSSFIRLGQQVCDPPSDCDRPWENLLDEFAETPFMTGIEFSKERPYGNSDDDLRFLYPGDDMILEWKEAQEAESKGKEEADQSATVSVGDEVGMRKTATRNEEL